MRLAVVESGDLAGEVLSFAARNQSHSVVSLQSIEQLMAPLPFSPAAVAVFEPPARPVEPAHLANIRTALPEAAVVVVSHTASSGDRTRLLRAGAHDVLSSPVNPFDLLLKLSTWSERPGASEASELRVELSDLVVDAERYRASKNGKALSLTPLELRILYCLAAHSPNLTPAERLLSFGWGMLEDPDTSLIRTHICHLRRKLEKAGGKAFVIKSKHTLGYTLVIDP
ncbi:MAG: response regulator transcription factor [Dehalococcoidia bacterium]|nr:response regulator transcription factor [Dehalococcoidia bacterium]